MKRLFSVFAVAVVAACSTSTEPDIELDSAYVTVPMEVTLSMGDDRTITGTVLRMSFIRVVEDSRCATDVVCVWEGNATVEIGIGAGMGPTTPLQMNTTLEPRFADWNDVRVTLLELTPAPISTDPIEPADYVVKLRLEPVA